MDLTKEMSGLKVSCIIDRQVIDEAVIYYKDECFYFLQSKAQGSKPKGDTGYPEYCYSWLVGKGTEKDLKADSVSSIVFFKTGHELWT